MADRNILFGNISSDDPVYQLRPYLQPGQEEVASITIVRGAMVGKRIPLGSGNMLFGRLEGNILSDVLASRRHMEITCENGSFILNDLESTNGTFVNGNRVQDQVHLQHGDFIRVGETILAFEIVGSHSKNVGFGAQTNSVAYHHRNEPTLQTKHLVSLGRYSVS